jgi:rhamnosyltransferase
MKNPKVSVIIPVRNGAETLDKCLKSLCAQTIGESIEIIVLDSMSTDGSREIMQGYGAKIADVPNDSFNHGLTRNMGVQLAKAPLVFFTVQDAWLSTNDLLEKMASHFNDPEVMAVVGHQAVPHEKDKNPLLWYNPISSATITERLIKDPAQFANLDTESQKALISWDNVISIYRRDALLEQPFVKTAFAEDWIWSYQALLKGWKLLHDSSLVVWHYHHLYFKFTFNAIYILNFHFHQFFGYKPSMPKVILPMIGATYHLLKHRDLEFSEKIYWIRYNFTSIAAVYLSTFNFLWRLRTGGEKSIEKGFKKYCTLIPQGKHKASNKNIVAKLNWQKITKNV